MITLELLNKFHSKVQLFYDYIRVVKKSIFPQTVMEKPNIRKETKEDFSVPDYRASSLWGRRFEVQDNCYLHEKAAFDKRRPDNHVM